MKGGKKLGFSGGPWTTVQFAKQWVRRCQHEEIHLNNSFAGPKRETLN